MNNLKKPYVIRVAEIIYSHISKIKKKHPGINTEQAINRFIDTEMFEKLSTGEIHDKWLNQLKKNNYIDEETGKKIPIDTFKLLEIQRDMMIKQLIKIPNLYDATNNSLIKLSTRAHKLLWRMCESYELWCVETNQDELLSLEIIN